MISIVIVGAIDLVRGALAAVLDHEEDFIIAADISALDDLLDTARTHRPHVVVLHLDQYGIDGVATAQRMAEELPRSRVLLLTSHRTAGVLRQALAAGVWGLMSPDIPPDRLVQAVRLLAAGERVVEPDLAVAALRPDGTVLTDQERAVLALAGEGLRSREIAERLFLSPGTVRNYLSAARRKTGARNQLEAVRRAREEGWL